MFTGCDRLGIPHLIADVRFKKANTAGSQWVAEVSSTSGKSLGRVSHPSSFAGQVYVERVARSHGADIPESFAAWLLRKMDEHGYSMNSIATAARVHQSTIRGILVGGAVPKDETIEKLQEVFNRHGEVSPKAEVVDNELADRVADLEARVANLEKLINRRGNGNA